MALKSRKVAIVGTGLVGSSTAFSLITQGVCEEILMIDLNEERALGEAMDLNHCIEYLNRKNEGSGIGLALVKSLVELHDGEVYLEDVSEGSEFVVKLPNIKINEEVNNHNRVMDVESKPLVQKINIEFSDIYELY